MKINETDGNDGHIYRLKQIDEIPEIVIAEREKRNKLSIKYSRGVNIIGVIDNCVGVTAIGLRITGVSLLSTIFAAPAVIGMKAVSIVMGLLRVVGNRPIKKMSLKIEKHEKIEMLAGSTLNIISSHISKALSDDSISDEEYALTLLEFDTFTQMKEDLRINFKMSLEKTGNIETEASACLIEIRQLHRLELMFKTMFKTMLKTVFKAVLKTMFKTVFNTAFETMFEK